VLVHCGAGVSRSACIVCMFLMRSRLWSAHAARAHCFKARSLVCPNDGFWRLLCSLEAPLGIVNRCACWCEHACVWPRLRRRASGVFM
jgi:dual specificity MAP kinase phosphatase